MYTTTTEPTKRYKCPVHHGKKPSVSVGFIDGRAWAKCWSQGCASADILAALGITNSQSIPWTPPPPPRPRPTFSVDYLPPVSPFAASEYLTGILTPSGSAIQYQRDDGQRGKHWRSDTKRRNPGVTGDGWQLRRFDPVDPSSAVAICLAEGEKDAAILAAAGLIAFTAPRGAQSLPLADFQELVDLAKATASRCSFVVITTNRAAKQCGKFGYGCERTTSTPSKPTAPRRLKAQSQTWDFGVARSDSE